MAVEAEAESGSEVEKAKLQAVGVEAEWGTLPRRPRREHQASELG